MLSRLLLAVFLFGVAESAKIAVFSDAFASRDEVDHIVRLANVLVGEGHDVFFVSAETGNEVAPSLSRSKLTQINTRVSVDEVLRKMHNAEHKSVSEEISSANWHSLRQTTKEAQVQLCDALLNHTKYLNELREAKFDAVFHSANDDCANGVAQYLGIDNIALLQIGPPTRESLDAVGIPTFQVLFPEELLGTGNVENLFQRVASFVLHWLVKYWALFEVTPLEMMRARLGSNISTNTKAKILLVAADAHLSRPVLTTSRVFFVDRLADEKLPQNLADFVHTSKQLVVVALGNSDNLAKEKLFVLEQTFKRLSHVSFVFETGHKDQLVDNVFHTAYVDKKTLLGRREAVLISNGNYWDLLDAVHTATPVLISPQTHAHVRNAELILDRRVGMVLSKTNFTSMNLEERIQQLLSDKELWSRCKELKLVLSQRSLDSKATITFATSVLLSSLPLDLPFTSPFKLHSLDIIALGIASIIVLKRLLRWYYWSCFEMSYKEKKE